MKAIVLGAEGMLGHKMYQVLQNRGIDSACTIFGGLDEPFYKKIDLFRQSKVMERIDVMQFDRLSEMLLQAKPEYIINCVGIIKQRAESKEAIFSIKINSLLPHLLAGEAKKWNGRLIHFSTDCVFSGKRGRYSEEDISDAEDLYGKTKYLGEVTEENALTIRTSIIGRELANNASLLEWFLTQQGKTIKGFEKVIYSGVTTNYLSETVSRLIESNSTLHGLYQLASTPISKYELLNMLKDAYNLDVVIEREKKTHSDRSMRGNKFLLATGFETPDWATLVAQLAADDTPYEKWK